MRWLTLGESIGIGVSDAVLLMACRNLDCMLRVSAQPASLPYDFLCVFAATLAFVTLKLYNNYVLEHILGRQMAHKQLSAAFPFSDVLTDVGALPSGNSRFKMWQLLYRQVPTAILFILIAVCTTLGICYAADPAEIASKLKTHDSMLDSVRIVYTLESRITLECEFLKVGSAFKLVERAPEIADSWYSFDGRHGYQVMFAEEDSSQMKSIRKLSRVPEAIHTHLNPLMFCGTALFGTNSPLHELMEHSTIDGTSRRGALSVIDINLGEHNSRSGAATKYWCQLAPEFDFSPISFSFQRDGAKRAEEFVVDEYKALHDPVLGEVVWFPWKMHAGSINKITVSSLDFHPELSTSAFVPVPQPGVTVVDETLPGGPRKFISQPNRTVEDALKSISDSLPNAPDSPGTTHYTASPQHYMLPLVIGGLFVGATLLAVAWYFHQASK